MGLALVRQIVKLSGGRLGVRSKVGEGSTFWVELPLGVGRKTLVHASPSDNTQPASERGSDTTTDLQKVCVAAGTKDSMPSSMSNSLSMAVDAAALRASQSPSVSGRSTAAMHSLMEQGRAKHDFPGTKLNYGIFRWSCRIGSSEAQHSFPGTNTNISGLPRPGA